MIMFIFWGGKQKMSFRNAGVDAVHFSHHHVAKLLQA